MTVPETDTGGQGEYPKALERTLVKELGKLAPYLRKKVCLSGEGIRSWSYEGLQ